MKLFELLRKKDVTGLSGDGIVAQGVQFDDGTICIRWLGQYSSLVIWKSIDDLLAINGHNGLTQVKWI